MTAPDRLSQAYFSATSGNPWTDSVSKIFTSLHARTKAAGPWACNFYVDASCPIQNRHGPILYWRNLWDQNQWHFPRGISPTWYFVRRSKKGTQIWVNGRLHAMLVFFRFGASILYNINWARGLTYLCTVDVRMDMTHVGCSEKLARSWMSSTTTSAIVACLRLGHRILP